MSAPVAITGLGAVTPAGVGADRFFQALFENRVLFTDIDFFDVSAIACRRAGRSSVPSSERSRALYLAKTAAFEALADAGMNNGDTALVVASNFFSYAEHPGDGRSFDADTLAEALSIKGIRFAISLSCASGASALSLAASLISDRRTSRVLVLGYDALAPFSWSGLCSLRTMSKDRPRPFSETRDGTIFSEGAVAAVLESRAEADLRGARIRAMLTGWATGNNAYHLTAPPPRGAGSLRVMASALAGAKVAPSRLDAVFAHATGTVANDITESEALTDLCGEASARLQVTGIKGAVGHLLGASGLAEMVAAVKTLESGRLPPCAGCDSPDSNCVPGVVLEGATGKYQTILCNSAGFGGCNAALVVQHESAPVRADTAPRRRVFIRQAGAVCAAGFGLEEIRAALNEGVFWEDGIPEYDVAEFGVSPKTYVDAVSRHSLCASAMALNGVERDSELGVFAGTEWGCVETTARFWNDYQSKGARFVRPFLFPHTYDNSPASLMAMEFGAQASHMNFSGAAAGALAVFAAFEAIARGDIHSALVCGGDWTGAASLLLSDEPGDDGCEMIACGIGVDLTSAQAQVCASSPQAESAGWLEPHPALSGLAGAARLPLCLALAAQERSSGLVSGGADGCRTVFLIGFAEKSGNGC